MLSIITAILYLLKDAAATFALLIIMRFIFLNELNFKKLKAVIIFSVLCFNAFFGTIYLLPISLDYRALMDFVSNITYIFIIQMFTDSKKVGKNIWTVFFFVFTVDMFYSLISPFVGDVLYRECIINVLLYLIIGAFIYFAVKNVQINFLPEVFAEIPKWIYAVIMLFDLTCYYKEFGESSNWYNVLYLVSSVAVVLCALYLVMKIFYMAHQQKEILIQMSMQKDFGEKTILGDEELRRFRHDYKNHMIVVNAYLERGKIDEAREYLNSLNNSINGVLNKIKTGNFVSDAILNSKAVTAAKSSIEFSFNGMIPSKGITDEDLCTILSNLIDNAIEACEKIPDKKVIDIESGISNGFFILSVSNPTGNKINPKLKTTKKDKKNHGIGLKNVERALKKYNGVMTADISENTFTADIRAELINE